MIGSGVDLDGGAGRIVGGLSLIAVRDGPVSVEVAPVPFVLEAVVDVRLRVAVFGGMGGMRKGYGWPGNVRYI